MSLQTFRAKTLLGSWLKSSLPIVPSTDALLAVIRTAEAERKTAEKVVRDKRRATESDARARADKASSEQ
jgi:hypothetical protein